MTSQCSSKEQPLATIHHTTLVPSKLELLTGWLPTRSWYLGTADAPDLAKAGGFRLDDPQDQVGIEFMFVIDRSDGRDVVYQVPMTYRGAPLPGAEAALIGTAEHGVLGVRWIYDGAADPVLMTQLLAAIGGTAAPQHASQSDTPEPAVVPRPIGEPPAGDPDRNARVALVRVLTGDDNVPDGTVAYLEAEWSSGGGRVVRGPVAILRGTGAPGETPQDPYDESNTDTFANDPD
jgi:hypothetical protein